MSSSQRHLVQALATQSPVGRLSRRDFILRAAALAGGAALASSSLARIARAQEMGPPPPQPTVDGVTVPPDDPTISAGMVEFGSWEPDGPMLQGYLARPAAPGIYPAVVIIHENRGLLEHYKDVARRYAREGFVAIAPDLLSRDGGTPNVDPAQVSSLLSRADPNRHASDAISAGAFVRGLEGVHPHVYGITGFCFGGAVTWRTTTQDPAIAAAVPYYGANPPLDAVPNIRAAVLGIYGGLDERINAGIPDLRAALTSLGIIHEFIIYDGANHAFFNDTGGARYHPEAAADAWVRTINWFRTYLPPAVA